MPDIFHEDSIWNKRNATETGPSILFSSSLVVECPNPLVLESGSVLPVQMQYFVNNKTTYECYSAYSLRGSASRVCQANGKWSGGTPICSRDCE